MGKNHETEQFSHIVWSCISAVDSQNLPSSLRLCVRFREGQHAVPSRHDACSQAWLPRFGIHVCVATANGWIKSIYGKPQNDLEDLFCSALILFDFNCENVLFLSSNLVFWTQANPSHKLLSVIAARELAGFQWRFSHPASFIAWYWFLFFPWYWWLTASLSIIHRKLTRHESVFAILRLTMIWVINDRERRTMNHHEPAKNINHDITQYSPSSSIIKNQDSS